MDRHGASEANAKPVPRSTSKTKYASKFLQTLVGDLHWISRSNRGLLHAFCRICNSHFGVAAGGWHGERGKTRTVAICLPPCVLLYCHYCASQAATQTAKGSFNGEQD